MSAAPVATATARDPLAMPLGVARAAQAHAIIAGFLKRRKLRPDSACRTFYTGAEWTARGEKYGEHAILIVVYDGGELGAALNIERAEEHDRGKAYNALRDALHAAGFGIEEGTHWFSMVYDRDALAAAEREASASTNDRECAG